MSNLQRAAQTPSQPTLIQTGGSTTDALPRTNADLARSQLTGVNVPESALGGKPYTAVPRGNGRTDFVGPNAGVMRTLSEGPVPIDRQMSGRDERAVDRMVQNDQGTTNKDVLNRPAEYHDAVVGRNYIEGGGVNGMSPAVRGQSATKGQTQSDVTPSAGRESGVDKILAEDAGRKYYPGERADQGSTAMRASYTLNSRNKPDLIVPASGNYAPYTPAELRKGETAKPAAEPAKPAPSVTGDPAQERIRALVRRQETGSFDGNYAKQNTGHKTSASGAYQFVDKTWRNAAREADVGTEYKRAYQAPKEVQDKVFDHYFKGLMDRTKGDFYKAINIHFTGNPEGRLSAAGKKANPTINAQGYRKAIQQHEAEYDKLKSTVASR